MPEESVWKNIHKGLINFAGNEDKANALIGGGIGAGLGGLIDGWRGASIGAGLGAVGGYKGKDLNNLLHKKPYEVTEEQSKQIYDEVTKEQSKQIYDVENPYSSVVNELKSQFKINNITDMQKLPYAQNYLTSQNYDNRAISSVLKQLGIVSNDK